MEQRNRPRIAYTRNIEIIKENQQVVEGEVLDISMSGLRTVCKNNFEVGDVVFINIPLVEEGLVIDIKFVAETVWVKPYYHQKDCVDMGCRIKAIHSGDSFHLFRLLKAQGFSLKENQNFTGNSCPVD